MDKELKQRLQFLADKYEQKSFITADPSQFIYWYKNPEEIEIASFIAAMLSFGNRKQFIPKITQIFQLADKAGGINSWLLSKAYESDFLAPEILKENGAEPKFYRFYSYTDMRVLFDCLNKILNAEGSLGNAIHKFANFQLNKAESTVKPMYFIVQDFFQEYFTEADIVPKGKSSANKRIHMFLRWMVRQNSPVDAGLWNWYPQNELLIPLDVHVMQEAIKLGLLPENASASFKTAVQLTQKMMEVFPSDPTRADFALFGLGVDVDSK